jgi:7-cyano-7-deazaguanine synthase
MNHEKKAVVLSSGGIDSTTAMFIAMEKKFAIYSLSFRYGQRHVYELKAAQTIAHALNVKKHLVLDIDLQKIGGSALTGHGSIPDAPGSSTEVKTNKIPVTYVPARNTIFLSFALAWAEVIGASNIFIGVNAIDYSGYPDCRPEYIEAFEKMANLATKAGVEGKTRIKIETPLIDMDKAQIIKKGMALGVDYSITHSCYNPDEKGLACGRCESCFYRRKGFQQAGLDDPTHYV